MRDDLTPAERRLTRNAARLAAHRGGCRLAQLGLLLVGAAVTWAAWRDAGRSAAGAVASAAAGGFLIATASAGLLDVPLLALVAKLAGAGRPETPAVASEPAAGTLSPRERRLVAVARDFVRVGTVRIERAFLALLALGAVALAADVWRFGGPPQAAAGLALAAAAGLAMGAGALGFALPRWWRLVAKLGPSRP